MAVEPLKVFISWSGSPSKEVASALEELLKFCGQWDTWMSDRSIESGSRGLNEIADQLAESNVGISLVTKENQNAPWLNFEAGALSKKYHEPTTRLVPLLVDMTDIDLTNGILKQFQYRKAEKKEELRLLLTDLATWGDHDVSMVLKRLDSAWDEYYEKYEIALANIKDHQPQTDELPGLEDEKLSATASAMLFETMNEVLYLVRQIDAENREYRSSAERQAAEREAALRRAEMDRLMEWDRRNKDGVVLPAVKRERYRRAVKDQDVINERLKFVIQDALDVSLSSEIQVRRIHIQEPTVDGTYNILVTVTRDLSSAVQRKINDLVARKLPGSRVAIRYSVDTHT